jgi:hypothetical protein
MPEIIIIPIGFDEPKKLGISEGSGDWVTDYEQDYSREFGMACWCDDMELCENEEHA